MTSPIINLRLPADWQQAIAQAADRDGVPLSAWLRGAIAAQLGEQAAALSAPRPAHRPRRAAQADAPTPPTPARSRRRRPKQGT